MDATRQIFWAVMVLATGFLCMTLRVLVDKHSDVALESLSLLQHPVPVFVS